MDLKKARKVQKELKDYINFLESFTELCECNEETKNIVIGTAGRVECILKDFEKAMKPVVPKFVADWYEEHIGTGEFEYLLYNLHIDYYKQKLDGEFKKWIGNGSTTKPIQTLVAMYQFGYEVEPEKEKLYIVKIPNSNGSNTYFTKDENGKVGLSNVFWDLLTEEEIKEENEWAWEFAKEVEAN